MLSSGIALVDSVESEYKQKKHLTIEPLLRRNPAYYKLEQYLSQEARDAIAAASSGIRIIPAMIIGGEESVRRAAREAVIVDLR